MDCTFGGPCVFLLSSPGRLTHSVLRESILSGQKLIPQLKLAKRMLRECTGERNKPAVNMLMLFIPKPGNYPKPESDHPAKNRTAENESSV